MKYVSLAIISSGVFAFCTCFSMRFLYFDKLPLVDIDPSHTFETRFYPLNRNIDKVILELPATLIISRQEQGKADSHSLEIYANQNLHNCICTDHKDGGLRLRFGPWACVFTGREWMKIICNLKVENLKCLEVDTRYGTVKFVDNFLLPGLSVHLGGSKVRMNSILTKSLELKYACKEGIVINNLNCDSLRAEITVLRSMSFGEGYAKKQVFCIEYDGSVFASNLKGSSATIEIHRDGVAQVNIDDSLTIRALNCVKVQNYGKATPTLETL